MLSPHRQLITDGVPAPARPFAWRRLRKILISLALCGAIAAAGQLCMAALGARLASSQLPRLGKIPEFQMRDQSGAFIADRDLQGQAFIADFFYASCTTSCPLLTAQMLALYHAAEEARLPVRFVSITLDPVNDTPEALRAYATRLGVTRERWAFLSGRDTDLNRVVVDGFKLYFEKAPPESGVGTIMHGEWLVLVDPRGQIRGYYHARDAEEQKRLLADTERAAREET